MDDVTLALEAFAYATLDDASGSVALLSRDGRIMAVNRAWREHAEQCGADMGTVGPGTDYLEVCTRSAAAGCEDARLALDGLHAVLDGRSDSFRFTYDFSFAGRPRWVELSARRLPGIGGALVSHIDTTVERDAQKAFESVGTWSSAIVRESPDLYSLNEPDGTVRWISPSVERLLGWSVTDLTGRNSFGLVHPDDLPGLAAQAEINQQTPGPSPPAVFRMQTKTGDYRYVEATLTNLTDDPAVRGMIVSARDVTDRVTFEHELTRLASTDSLTGLANRASLLATLASRMADPQGAAVPIAYVDLDGFRLVNDSLGHAGGDTLLVQVAERLTASLAPGEVVARIGGDEFVVILSADEDPVICVRRILAVFDEPFAIGQQQAAFHASVGITSSRPGQSVTPEELLSQADTAMYSAKETAGLRWRAFDESMRAKALRHVAIAAELVQALRDGDIRPDFQPVYDLSDGRLVGVEALARWHRADGSVWAPRDFLEVCETSGQAGDLGLSMLDQSCRALAEWNQVSQPWVAVNVAAEQFIDPTFVDSIDEVLARYGLPAHSLQLEITESQALDAMIDPTVLVRLNDRGIRLALDDFGTGWSSLARLAVMPVSSLKIDRSFVAAMLTDDTARAIAESVAALARILGLQTVAEGVETTEQLAAVRELGVTTVQGYLTGHPGALTDIRPRIDQVTG